MSQNPDESQSGKLSKAIVNKKSLKVAPHKVFGVVRSEEERCNAPVLIRSIFPFDNADCRANSLISPTPIVGLIPLLNRATLVPHLSPTIGTIRSLNTNCQDAM
ncbi:hypothetical protein [Microcystis sp. LE19-59.1C]|uniref:hypothetical protein n=1 Tax=Microcystis sp. LE19-59.1C TaxID=3016442 RepID=UPI0022CCE022|nr:hypothetical protein [Microcystis sp. LE19-59.1C]MCZ8291360.1 hypothetical protein [Microcystis sp. LE19-59.1C]